MIGESFDHRGCAASIAVTLALWVFIIALVAKVWGWWG